MISVNSRGIREHNKKDLVITYSETLDNDFSIFQETNLNLPNLQDIRELWDGDYESCQQKYKLVVF